MKKNIITILLLLLVHVTSVHALDDPLQSQVGNGPIKQVTITICPAENNANLFYGEPSREKRKIICWYDSVGRLEEEANYIDNRLLNGYVCQYLTDNVCMHRHYDINGLIKGDYDYIVSDSAGRKITSKKYSHDKFCYADSVVYNERGQETKKYETSFRKDSLILRYTYMYDSLGRLSAAYDIIHDNRLAYTIEYQANGNYIEHHMGMNGKTWQRKVFVDKDGHVTKMEDGDMLFRFSDFDQFGNWRIMKSFMTTNNRIGRPVDITERTIEYYE